ncbi:MAG: exported protein of unknown function, partial [Dehalococcoidia bacterium]|nr:exported protein of unknown function [Dehalococcoidia bacterium]
MKREILRVFGVTLALTLLGITLPVVTAASDPSLPGKIAFYSFRDLNEEIYLMNDDGSGQTRITNNGDADNDPALSPDGAKIAFSSWRDGNSEIYVMNSDGTNQTRLTTNGFNVGDYSPAWSPDGTRIAFFSSRDGNNEIYVMSADGSGQTRLTSNPAPDEYPAWSPDGQRIAFASPRDGVEYEIYVMNANGSDQTRITNNTARDFKPAWSPDGSKIVFTSWRDVNTGVYVMNPNGTGQTYLSNGSSPAWSPDGSKIAFEDIRGGNSDIYVMNADGSHQIRLTNDWLRDAGPSYGVSTNRAPVLASIGNKTVDEGQLLTFAISATDPEGDPLTYSASNLPPGASFDPPTRSFSWTPGYDQAGTWPGIRFSISDGSLTDWEGIAITVTNVNQPPVLAPIGNKTVSEGQLLTITASATDLDGQPLTYSASNLPPGAGFVGQTFSWTPNYRQAGTYTGIRFQVSDGSSTGSETITIQVGNVSLQAL